MIVVESALLLHLLAEPGYAKCQAPSALVRPYVARAVRERDAAPWRFSRDHCAEFHVWWHALFSAPRATRSKRAKQPASREGRTTRGGWTPKRRSRRRSRQQALERQAEKPHRLEEEKKRASKKLPNMSATPTRTRSHKDAPLWDSQEKTMREGGRQHQTKIFCVE